MVNEKVVKTEGVLRPPEVLKTPEKVAEVPRTAVLEEKQLPAEVVTIPVPHLPLPAPLVQKEPILTKIEGILSEDLADVYENLPDALKPKFRAKGEETAGKIQQMMQDAKVKARKVLKLIKEWLKMIPGVNKFFLEQEATIKTQKLLGLKQEDKET